MGSSSKKSIWTGRILSVVAVAPFLFGSIMKLAGVPQVVQGFEHFGWPQTMVVVVGILEITSAVLYLIPQVAVLGAIVLTGFLGGAIATHLRIGEPVYLHMVIGLLIWGGLFLREPRLQALLPLRKSRN